MANIAKLIGCREQTGDIGIEIEMEADNIPRAETVSKHWRLEHDPSLRGESGEFVLKKPLTTKQLDGAFAELSAAMASNNTRVRPTYRAGVHVHINVQDLTPKQLVTYIATYLMLEEVLITFCDPSRAGNHFCLRMSDASYSLDVITSMIMSSQLNLLNTEDLRYASINVTSLFKYGSVEFRALESTTDFNRIKTWASILYTLKEFAKTVNNPTDLLGRASEQGFVPFAEQLLAPYIDHFRYVLTEDRIRIGVRNIQYAIYSRRWDEVNLNIFDKNISLFAS